MPPVPPGAAPPSITNEEIARMFPAVNTLFERLNQGESLAPVARELAPQAGVTPGQLVLYAIQMVQANTAPPGAAPRPTGGFPVGPASAPRAATARSCDGMTL